MFPKGPKKADKSDPDFTPPKVPKRRVKYPLKDVNYMGDQKYGDYRPARFTLSDEVVVLPWNDEEARKRLMESRYNHAFFHLAHTYQPQKNPFYCGVAVMVIALNALRLDEGKIPSQPEFHYHHFDYASGELRKFPYRMYSQITFLDEETDQIKPRNEIAPKDNIPCNPDSPFNPGLNLHQVKEILELYETIVQEEHAMDDIETGINAFRDTLKKSLVHDEEIIIVNFDGDTLGMTIGGHFALVGAYHAKTDTVLILDPAAHKTAWYWTPIDHLYFAMHTLDYILDQPTVRGYLIVKDKPTEVTFKHPVPGS